MTPNQIIPGRKYLNSMFELDNYYGEGDVDPDTLDCTNRRMMVEANEFDPERECSFENSMYAKSFIPAQKGFDIPPP